MTDKKKVINALELCAKGCNDNYGCIYLEEQNKKGGLTVCRCIDLLARDVLALLKEQEEEIENLKQTAQSMMEGICLLKEQKKGTVISIHRNGFGSRVGACPNCQSLLHYEYNQSFCGKCGQAVNWNENQNSKETDSPPH